jgi:ferredoxin
MSNNAEKLRCNVCEVALEPSGVKEHSASEAHLLRKTKLEEELREAAAKKYGQDSSVVVRWTSSIAALPT